MTSNNKGTKIFRRHNHELTLSISDEEVFRTAFYSLKLIWLFIVALLVVMRKEKDVCMIV